MRSREANAIDDVSARDDVAVETLIILCPRSGKPATCTLVAVDGTYAEVLSCSELDGSRPVTCDQRCARMLNHDVDLDGTHRR
jgi:hypothetical protein